MASKEDLVKSIIIKQNSGESSSKSETDAKSQTEETTTVEVIVSKTSATEGSSETGQEYVYWARRGENELETAGEVEVSSSGVEQENVNPEECGELLLVRETEANGAQISSVRDPNSLVYGLQVAAEQITAAHEIQTAGEAAEAFGQITEEFIEQQQRLEAKREAAKLQEKLMNEEYQKAIGYLLCSSKSKSGKQKKKQTMTAYLFFCRRYRAKIVARNPKLSFAQISKLLSHMWRNASEQEKNTYRLKLEQHRTKVNAIVEKNMIEKMKMVKQQKLMEEIQRRSDEEHPLIATSSAELHDYEVVQQHQQEDSEDVHQEEIPVEEEEESQEESQLSIIESLEKESVAAAAEITQTTDDGEQEEETVEQNEEPEISHAVIDPQTKMMLLEGES